jgi:hypothetical protein
VLDLAAATLVPAGVLVVEEWARERFDGATAGWCFARLPGPGEDRGWLNDRYEHWQASGQAWDAYLRSWADGEGLHQLLSDGQGQRWHLLHACRADLLRRLGRTAEAGDAYRTALALDPPPTERDFLARRLAEIDRKSAYSPAAGRRLLVATPSRLAEQVRSRATAA